MGKLKGGPFGLMTGKTGNLVSYELNGENVTRIKGTRTKPLTKGELKSCDGMRVIQAVLRTFKPVLMIGFARQAKKMAGQNYYNQAVSYNKRYAVLEESDNVAQSTAVDYPKLLVSSGILPPPLNPGLSVHGDEVKVTWSLQPDLEFRHLADRTIIVLYFPSGTDGSGLPCAVWELSGARRSACSDVIHLNPEYAGKPFEAYLAFKGLMENEVSDSVWLKH